MHPWVQKKRRIWILFAHCKRLVCCKCFRKRCNKKIITYFRFWWRVEALVPITNARHLTFFSKDCITYRPQKGMEWCEDGSKLFLDVMTLIVVILMIISYAQSDLTNQQSATKSFLFSSHNTTERCSLIGYSVWTHKTLARCEWGYVISGCHCLTDTQPPNYLVI